jgi:hypothetical protein
MNYNWIIKMWQSTCTTRISLVAYVKSHATHDVITFHMDDVYGQHIHLHPLTIHIKFATIRHYLQLCYNPLQSAI